MTLCIGYQKELNIIKKYQCNPFIYTGHSHGQILFSDVKYLLFQIKDFINIIYILFS